MKKETFIEAIEAIEKQINYDSEVSEHLGKAFPDAFSANLLPKNHYLQNALIQILQEEMEPKCGANSWIEYFCWELDFGKKYRKGMVLINDKAVPLRTIEDLWNILQETKAAK